MRPPQQQPHALSRAFEPPAPGYGYGAAPSGYPQYPTPVSNGDAPFTANGAAPQAYRQPPPSASQVYGQPPDASAAYGSALPPQQMAQPVQYAAMPSAQQTYAGGAIPASAQRVAAPPLMGSQSGGFSQGAPLQPFAQQQPPPVYGHPQQQQPPSQTAASGGVYASSALYGGASSSSLMGGGGAQQQTPPAAGSVGGAGVGVGGGRSSYYPAPGAYAAGGVGAQPDAAAQQLLQDMLQFNAPRHFVRASVGKLPGSSSLRHKSHAPLGVVLQPLAPTPAGQPEVPAVSFGGSGVVVRCKRCRTYVNPFVVWEASGRKWTCNLCAASNETPQFYCRAIDDKGRREDRFERAELCMGSVEVIAPSDYMIRPPQPPAFLFLLDVSLPAVASGLVEEACRGIADAVRADRLPGDSRTMVGIVTYDSSVHFYALKANFVRPQVLLVSQIDDLFLPLSDDLFVPLQECKKAVLETLEAIPEIWRSNVVSENCLVDKQADLPLRLFLFPSSFFLPPSSFHSPPSKLFNAVTDGARCRMYVHPSGSSVGRLAAAAQGSAVKAATMAMKHVGGKLLLFSSAPPTVGDLVVKREASKDKNATQSGDRETDLLKPASDAYQSLGQQLTQSQVSVDLFLCPAASPASASVENVYYPPPPTGSHAGQPGAPPLPGGVQTGGAPGRRASGGTGAVGVGGSLGGVSFYDVATYAPLAQCTSGEVRFYAGFSRQQHGPKLRGEIDRVLSRVTGWEAVMRVRVSRGWRVAQRHGRFLLRGSDLFVLPTVSEDQSFSIALELDDSASAQSAASSGGAAAGTAFLDSVVALQAALLYTNSAGERRIRVHTFCIPITQSIQTQARRFLESLHLQEIAASLDADVAAALMVQHAMDLSLRAKVADGRSYLQNLCVQLMGALQPQSAAAAVYGGQPQATPHSGEALRRLAMLIMGLLKSPAFRNTKDCASPPLCTPASLCLVTLRRAKLSSVPLSQLIAFCCPRMFALCDWSEVEGTVDGNECVVLPATLPLSSASMTQDGAFLVENGESMLLWIGKSVPSSWLVAVFGVATLEFLHPEAAAASLGQTADPLGARTLAVVRELQRQRMQPDLMQLCIIRQGDATEQLFVSKWMMNARSFFSMLIEDRVQSLPLTFAEFLQKVGQRQMAPVGAVVPGSQRAY